MTAQFGDLTGDYYYVSVNGGEPVYTVSSSVIDGLGYTLDDMAVLDAYPAIGSGNLVSESITQNGETTTYDSENEDQDEDIAAVAGGLGAVTLSDVADYSVADEDRQDSDLTKHPELQSRRCTRRKGKKRRSPCILALKMRAEIAML